MTLPNEKKYILDYSYTNFFISIRLSVTRCWDQFVNSNYTLKSRE